MNHGDDIAPFLASAYSWRPHPSPSTHLDQTTSPSEAYFLLGVPTSLPVGPRVYPFQWLAPSRPAVAHLSLLNKLAPPFLSLSSARRMRLQYGTVLLPLTHATVFQLAEGTVHFLLNLLHRLIKFTFRILTSLV